MDNKFAKYLVDDSLNAIAEAENRIAQMKVHEKRMRTRYIVAGVVLFAAVVLLVYFFLT